MDSFLTLSLSLLLLLLLLLLRCASHRLAAIQQELQIPVIFKASFDKANRQDLSRYANMQLSK